MNLKKISCFSDEGEIQWEGHILLKPDNYFVGIISDPDTENYYNKMINGIYYPEEDQYYFKVICPEEFNRFINQYRISYDVYSGDYTGEMVDIYDDYEGPYHFNIQSLNVDPEILEAEMFDLEYIVQNYMDTLKERYSKELLDEEDIKLHYYL